MTSPIAGSFADTYGTDTILKVVQKRRDNKAALALLLVEAAQAGQDLKRLGHWLDNPLYAGQVEVRPTVVAAMPLVQSDREQSVPLTVLDVERLRHLTQAIREHQTLQATLDAQVAALGLLE